ncbi:MAG TPA: methyltransferase [bacterium]|nr:methyltransferase [bacterium]
MNIRNESKDRGSLDPEVLQCHNDQKHRYGELYRKYQDSPQGMHFVSGHTQLSRFLQFLQMGNLEGKKVLDLGCGFGDFYKFLKEQGICVQYRGYDIVREFITCCREKFPDGHFEERDILFKKPRVKFDYVIASGVFAHANLPFFKEMIKVAYGLCRTAFGFNMFDTAQEDFFHIDEEEVLHWCRQMNPADIKVTRDYLPGDYTVFVYR